MTVALPWRLKVIFDSTTLEMQLSQRPWVPSSLGHGGSDRMASGRLVAFEVRRDELLRLRLRFRESEWPAVRDWIAWGQGGGLFNVSLDQVDLSGVECDLDQPSMGERVEPVREGAGKYLSIEVAVRRTDGIVWDREYFGVTV